jgi:DNA repair exonuclease SbcCD ATPase subunit
MFTSIKIQNLSSISQTYYGRFLSQSTEVIQIVIKPMTMTHTDELKLIQDVESLRIQIPQTKELYREVCRLMFFRYGVQPTANKLYQLVRKGTIATPSQAVNHFWSELREKRSIDIEHPALPDSLREFASEALSTLWKGALEVARQNYQSKQLEVDGGRQHTHKHELDHYKSQLKHLEDQYSMQQRELEKTKKQLQEDEKRRLLEGQVLATQKELAITLQNEKAVLEASLKNMGNEFTAEIKKLHSSLKLADDRFRKLEAKSNAEIERERQRSFKLESEIADLKKALLKEHAVTKDQTGKNQKLINELRENIGLIKGQLKESQRQQLAASNKLKQIERKKTFLK